MASAGSHRVASGRTKARVPRRLASCRLVRCPACCLAELPRVLISHFPPMRVRLSAGFRPDAIQWLLPDIETLADEHLVLME